MKPGQVDPSIHDRKPPLKSTFDIRRAGAADGERVRALLARAELPLAGLTPGMEHFLIAHRGEEVIGAIGLELYPPLALLRSAVVAPGERGTGVGAALVGSIEDLARFAGIQRLVLLTTTAERFFTKHGFHRIERTSLSGPVTTSAEFTGACPSSAVCMEKQL
jgi:amino-acid N-acetyltransferase